MRVVVTGANGFIGGAVARYLNSQYEVITVPYKEALTFEFNAGDVLIHSAGLAHGMARENSEYIGANFDFTLKLASKFSKLGGRLFIFLSSVTIVGSKPGIYDENANADPENTYAKSKMLAEMALEELYKNNPSQACIALRIPMVYGSGAKGNAAKFSDMAKRKIPLPLGGVTGRRSFLHIDNFCKGIEKIISRASELNGYDLYNLTDNDDMTSGELYSKIYREINGSSGMFYFPETILKLLALLPGLDSLKKLTNEYRFPMLKFISRFG